MRLDSCRTCGVQMEPDAKCTLCEDFVTTHCPKCGKTVDTQVHVHNS